MFKQYVIMWKEELIWAALTFGVSFGAAFLLQDSTPADGWQNWVMATALGSSRLVVVGLVKTGTKMLTNRKGD